MNAPWRIPLMVVAALLQIAAPVSLILRYENTLTQGKAFKVRCLPVDPEDVFRGRYLALHLQIDAAFPQEKPKYYGEGWLELTEGPDGFARVEAFHDLKEPQCARCLKGRGLPLLNQETEKVIPSFAPEVNRFYVDEQRARRVDQLFQRATREKTAWAVVRVKNGLAAIENIFIDGRSVNEL